MSALAGNIFFRKAVCCRPLLSIKPITMRNQYLPFLACAILIFLANKAEGQSLTASVGIIYMHTAANPPIAEGREDFSSTGYMASFSYENFFKDKKYSIIGIYGKFRGCTNIPFRLGSFVDAGGVIVGKGFCAGVNVRRYDVGMAYLLTKRNRKFYLKPFLAAGLQTSRVTGVEYWNDGTPVNGPDYFELEPVIAEPRNTVQVVPSLGFRTGFVFWKRLDINLSVQGVYGFKAYQKMYMKYQYKGVIQPPAEYEATGTGVFVMLGAGYRFAKLIK
jgi:hypothetical protein